MRPLELRIRNFRSYSGEHVFDFRDRTLVGIVGPIGSGKSSLLDAIAFALYGRTPRIGSATTSLINQRAADGSVLLRFEVEGEVWEAVRSLRVKGQSKHALYRYEADAADAEPVERVLMEGEVNQRIADLLGLDFDAFERSVLLAQGRFAEFLLAPPAKRDRVLKGVFGHDRIDAMRAIAKERRDGAATELEKLAVRIERYDEVKARLVETNLELEVIAARHELLTGAASAAAGFEKAIAAADGQVATLSERLAVLESNAGRLPDPAATNRMLADAAAAAERRGKLAAELHEAQERLAATELALEAVNAAGESTILTKATALLSAAEPQLKAVVAADRRIGEMTERDDAAVAAVEAALTRVTEAERARDSSLGRSVEAAKILEEAEATLVTGRHLDMVSVLRRDLEAGELCPVCEQPVAEIPPAAAADHLEELEEVVAAARQAKLDIDQAHTVALTVLERTKEQVASARERAATAAAGLAQAREDAATVRAELEETTMRLEKLLGPGDPASHLEERRTAYERMVAERDEAARRVEQIRGRHDQAIRDEQEAGKAMQDLGVLLADLAARLESPIELGSDAATLRAAFDQVQAEWKESTAQVVAARDEAAAELDAARRGHAELMERMGIEASLASEVAVLEDRRERLRASAARDEDELGRANEMYASRDSLEEQTELYARINADLTDSRFVRYLLDDERARLAELGSEHFQRLSAGRYRFADDRFSILDLAAADTTRRSDSLSGGETFLASLGLALALAEMVTRTGGRLDAFLLDEGFGTLDPEHLDLAMEGVERLVADDAGRLVVIVSHVPELRQRLEDVIELERNPVTGDTRVLSS
jgi:exonuclease SbcC